MIYSLLRLRPGLEYGADSQERILCSKAVTFLVTLSLLNCPLVSAMLAIDGSAKKSSSHNVRKGKKKAGKGKLKLVALYFRKAVPTTANRTFQSSSAHHCK